MPPVPKKGITINDCDQTDGWRGTGNISFTQRKKDTPQGAGHLKLELVRNGKGGIVTPVPIGPTDDSYALALKLCGAWPASKAVMSAVISTAQGIKYQKQLDIGINEWRDILLLPSDFKTTGSGEPAPRLAWSDVVALGLHVDNSQEASTSRILVDDIAFQPLHLIGPRDPRKDHLYWWWDGNFDPFLARHASQSDWAHRQDQPQHAAPVKFDRFILSPYQKYTAYIHSDRVYDRTTLTITDWELNPLQVLSLGTTHAQVTPIHLTAPNQPGTYLVNLERYMRGADQPQHYQTGIMVLAKQLSEPRGLWGVHAYMMHSAQTNHFDIILDMFQAAGILMLREDVRMPMRKPDEYDHRWDIGVRRDYYRQMQERGIDVLSILQVTDHPAVATSIAQNKFVPADTMDQFLVDVEQTARNYRGLVDWYELGNEMNERDLAPYADLLKKSYAALKRGDPNSKLMMCGCHSEDRWQMNLYQMEKAETDPRYRVYQDTIATHPYPPIWGIEPLLRYWLYEKIGVETLRAKGTMMTEASWPPLSPSVQALLHNGFIPRTYNGELDYQCWLGVYANTMLGEYQKIGATLHGLCFFRFLTVLKNRYIVWDDGTYRPGELAMPSQGYFVEGDPNLLGWHVATVPRPIVYTHNTIARLLTHEVRRAEIEVTWDRQTGHLEHYAFARSGETIAALWIGPALQKGYTGWGQEPRAQTLDVTVRVPADIGMAIAVGLTGIERPMPIEKGQVQICLSRAKDITDANGQILLARGGQVTWLRLLQGTRHGNVFVQDKVAGNRLERLGKLRVLSGTPKTNPQLVDEIAQDRNLPALGPKMPTVGYPMVLYSPKHHAVYLVGRKEQDVERARQVWGQLSGQRQH